jgi:hypothetical protein
LINTITIILGGYTVKALVISMLILLITFFGLIPVFGQPSEDKPAQPIEQKEKSVKEPETEKTTNANAIAEANAVVETNKVTDMNAIDANSVRARIDKFEGLGGSLEQLSKDSGDEIREWTRGRLDDRLELALAMQKQITAEFKFLRELAVKEGAGETTAAIDGILLDRQQRFKGVIDELEKNSERLRRLMEREERRNKERERIRERTRERPDRSRQDTQH